MIPGSWQHRMKLQLFLKASKAYYVLSDAATNLLKYGRALRYIKLSLQCYGKDFFNPLIDQKNVRKVSTISLLVITASVKSNTIVNVMLDLMTTE